MHTYSALIRDEQQLTRFLGSLSDDASRSVLIQLLSSQDERQIRSYAQLIEERLPEAKIIGHSTRHVIHQGDIHHHSTLIAVSVFCCTQLSATEDRYRNQRAVMVNISLMDNMTGTVTNDFGLR